MHPFAQLCGQFRLYGTHGQTHEGVRNGLLTWALTDHQGTVRDWVESADFYSNNVVETQVINHLNFDAFGNLQSVTDNTGQPTTLDSRLTILPAYTGQLYDADAGLHYYKARWYDSIIGKFISEDPMGFEAGDVNVSRMVTNAVAADTDATGLWGDDLSYNPYYPPLQESAGHPPRGGKLITVRSLREVR